MRYPLVLLTLIALVIAGCANSQRERDENEVEVLFDDVPQAVRDALTRESGGAPVGAITRETENGRAVYEAKITREGTTWEVEVDESGKVLEREEAD